MWSKPGPQGSGLGLSCSVLGRGFHLKVAPSHPAPPRPAAPVSVTREKSLGYVSSDKFWIILRRLATWVYIPLMCSLSHIDFLFHSPGLLTWLQPQYTLMVHLSMVHMSSPQLLAHQPMNLSKDIMIYR